MIFLIKRTLQIALTVNNNWNRRQKLCRTVVFELFSTSVKCPYCVRTHTHALSIGIWINHWMDAWRESLNQCSKSWSTWVYLVVEFVAQSKSLGESVDLLLRVSGFCFVFREAKRTGCCIVCIKFQSFHFINVRRQRTQPLHNTYIFFYVGKYNMHD